MDLVQKETLSGGATTIFELAVSKMRSLFSRSSQALVGLDVGSSAVKLAVVKPVGENYELQALGSRHLPPDAIVDGVIISKLPVADAIEELFKENNIRNNNVATSISGNSVIVKKVVLPAMTASELEESIQWEAEQYIPFDISDVNVDYQVLETAPDGKVEVLLVAAKKETIMDYTSVVSMAGKSPVVVDIDAFALQNVYTTNYDPEPHSVVALVNIGSTVMNINIVQGKELLFTRDMAMGGFQYTDFIQKELNLPFAEAEQYKKLENLPGNELVEITRILNSVTENLTLEVEKTFDYFKTTTKSLDIEAIYLSGGASRTVGLCDYIAENFECPVEFLDPFSKVWSNGDLSSSDNLNSPEETADFAVAIGLALRTGADR